LAVRIVGALFVLPEVARLLPTEFNLNCGSSLKLSNSLVAIKDLLLYVCGLNLGV
jgi:hypothetical protein